MRHILWQHLVGLESMLKVFVDSFAILGRFATLIDHILHDTLTEVTVGAVLVQFD
jgi:hypothetical protein